MPASWLLCCLFWVGLVPWRRSPLSVIALTVVSAVVGLGVGDTLYLFSLKSVGVSVAVPLAATYPLFSLVLATALLGQD